MGKLPHIALWFILAALLAAGQPLCAQILNKPDPNANIDLDSLRQAQRRDSVTFAGGTSDTTKKKRFYSHKVTYTIGTDNATTYTIDTGLDNKQIIDPAMLADFSYRNTGNIGSAAVPIIFNPNLGTGFDLGFHAFDLYGYNRRNILFYDSKVPYTHLSFLFGMRKEQYVGITHNQNIGQYFNVAFQFKRIASTGGYANQATNDNSFNITTRFRSKSDQYRLTAIFLFNSYKAQQNGGVTGTDIFDGTAQNTTLVNPELLKANLKQKQMAFYLRQEWRQGRRVERKINDSTSISYLFPNLTFYHELEIGNEQFQYFDIAPLNTAYYGRFTTDDDSLFNRIKSSHWGNTLGFTYAKIKDIDTAGAIYRNFLIDGSAYQSLGTVTQDYYTKQVQEIRFDVRLRSHPDARSGLLYNASASYNLMGYNNQDLKLDGSLGYKLKKYGSLLAFGSFTRKEAPWVMNHFYLPAEQEENGFKKTITLMAGLSYEIPQWRLKVSGQFYNVTYPTFWNTNRLPDQLGGSVQAWVVRLEKNFRWRHFGSDNLVVLQFFTGQNILRYPMYWGKQSLFYENKFFKNNLQFRTGVDVYYNTNYAGYGYFGYTDQFHLQDQLTMKYYPVVDVFISMKIAEAIVFLKFENADEGIFHQKGYYGAYKYPMADRAFKVGVLWRFYE